MHRQHIEPGQRIIHNLSKPLKERVKSRKLCGPYVVTPPRAGKDKERFFYLGSDFMPALNWSYAGDVVSLNHTGWCTDEFGDGDTIMGIVFTLPNRRGFLAGWTMGQGMASALDISEIFDSEIDAAYCADSMAENAAENERECQAEQESSDDE